jgi:hypothetical protein
MSAVQHASRALPAFNASPSLLRRVGSWLNAMLSPGEVIAEVEQWRALLIEADRIEVENPARAAEMRQRAARLGRL